MQTALRESFQRIAKEKWGYERAGTVIGLNKDGTM